MWNKITESFDRWIGRASGVYTFWPLLPSGAIALAMGYFSTGVDWISQFGAFGWLGSALLAFVVSAASFALVARATLWRIDARLRKRLESGSSAFDPMATVYENKRLFLSDLAPAGRRTVEGRTFIKCELIGPGTAKLSMRSSTSKPWPTLTGNLMYDVDCVQVDSEAQSFLAVYFPDCHFYDCKFYNMSLLFDQYYSDETWNWITKDLRQLSMLEGGDQDESPQNGK